jgi:DNA ligase-1
VIKRYTRWIGLLFLLFNTPFAFAVMPPEVMLAKSYQQGINLEHYWVSEKLDGVRAYWDGQHLVSRNGNIYHAPPWFIAHFPAQPLDGELWIGRGTFQTLVSTVRKQIPDHEAWRAVKYMVFDLPTSMAPFTKRYAQLKQLINRDRPILQLVKQFRVTNNQDLMTRLDEVIGSGGEGLMLHRGEALYRSGRSSDLLKVKRFQDAEATVTKHHPGKGKFSGMLGSIEVQMPNGKRFRIGSGFSNQERKEPPAIGSTITYKYFDLSKRGIPRFATFLRKRAHF